MNSYCPECHSTFERGGGICPHDNAELIPADQRDDPFEGAVLEDRYRLDRMLGAGGMGMVYRATQLAVDRDVAVKILRDELETDSEANARFSREAQYISSLNHPNIVQLIDFGRDPELDSWFLVMEHVDGRSLAQLLADGRIAYELALEIVYQCCGALMAAHERDMIHRDLKPDNLHLTAVADGTLQVKVLDFGIARCLEQTTKLTETGMICGTPAYMAPEQAEDGEIGPETDIYSLGVCLYEMLTGELPFEGERAMELMMQHLTADPDAVADRVPDDAPVEQLQNLIDSMLAKERADRPETAREVQTRIEEIRRSEGQPVHGLSKTDDWMRRIEEMVRPRVGGADLEEPESDERESTPRSDQEVPMTGRTLQTLHPTFKKAEMTPTREWSEESQRSTDEVARDRDPSGPAEPGSNGTAAVPQPDDDASSVHTADGTSALGTTSAVDLPRDERAPEPDGGAGSTPESPRWNLWQLAGVTVVVTAFLVGGLLYVVYSGGGAGSPEAPASNRKKAGSAVGTSSQGSPIGPGAPGGSTEPGSTDKEKGAGENGDGTSSPKRTAPAKPKKARKPEAAPSDEVNDSPRQRDEATAGARRSGEDRRAPPSEAAGEGAGSGGEDRNTGDEESPHGVGSEIEKAESDPGSSGVSDEGRTPSTQTDADEKQGDSLKHLLESGTLRSE
ncbi:MAG: protein kinase [Bradymonadaceae bacterium]